MRWIVLWTVAGCAFSSPYNASERATQALCERAYDCSVSYPEGAQLTFDQVYQQSEASCIGELGPYRADAWRQAEDDGLLSYSRDSAKVCVAQIEALSCEEIFEGPLPEPCHEMVRGTLSEREECTFDEVCVSGWCRDGLCAPDGA